MIQKIIKWWYGVKLDTKTYTKTFKDGSTLTIIYDKKEK